MMVKCGGLKLANRVVGSDVVLGYKGGIYHTVLSGAGSTAPTVFLKENE